MGKVIFEFDTGNPDDWPSIELHHRVEKMHSALWDTDQKIRSIVKYGDKDWPDDVYEFLEDLRKELWESEVMDV